MVFTLLICYSHIHLIISIIQMLNCNLVEIFLFFSPLSLSLNPMFLCTYNTVFDFFMGFWSVKMGSLHLYLFFCAFGHFSFCLFWPLPMCLFLFYHIVLYYHPLDACFIMRDRKWPISMGEEVGRNRQEWRLLPNSNHELTGKVLWWSICSLSILQTASKNGCVQIKHLEIKTYMYVILHT